MPGSGDTVIEPWSADTVVDTYAWPEQVWVRANLVASPAGSITGSSGTSSDLTTSEDRDILRRIRATCDALIVGAASIRAEGWHLPPRGHTIVLSAEKALPWESCPDASRVTVWPSAPGEDLASAVHRLVDHVVTQGYRSVLCEGGLATVRALAHEKLLHEVCVTVRGSGRTDVLDAFRALLPDAAGCTPYRMMASPDNATIFSVWRCATDSAA